MADVFLDGILTAASADALKPPRRILVWTLASTLMVLALIVPALWNGFPLIFPDTGGYLDRPVLGTLGMGRSALYGLFLNAGTLFAFWPNVILQSSLIVWIVVLTMRTMNLGHRPWLALCIVAFMTLSTSLPWFTSQLMPDILFPTAVLALYLLSCGSNRLVKWERCILVGVIAFAIASHMAAAGLCVALVAVLSIAAWFKLPVPQKPSLWLATSSVVIGLALCPISNHLITGNFAFTPGGSSFLFGRLVEDGIVARYLNDNCPSVALRLCEYKDTMPTTADGWLWSNDSPYRQLDDWSGYTVEEWAITKATLEHYPLMHASTAISAAIKQLVTFRTEIEVENNAPTINMLGDHFPQLFVQLIQARQQSQRLDVTPLNFLHVPLATLAVTGLGLAFLLRRRLKITPEASALCVFILLALAANASICGIFSHPSDRYQSRLMLLAPLVTALLIVQRRGATVLRSTVMHR